MNRIGGMVIRDQDCVARRSSRKIGRGATLIAAIVCLLVIMLFSRAVVKAITIQRVATRLDEQQLQCLFIAESAFERAKIQLARDPNYVHETWRIALERYGITQDAIVEIKVEAIANEPRKRRLQIEARWPDDPIASVAQNKVVIISLPESGSSS